MIPLDIPPPCPIRINGKTVREAMEDELVEKDVRKIVREIFEQTPKRERPTSPNIQQRPVTVIPKTYTPPGGHTPLAKAILAVWTIVGVIALFACITWAIGVQQRAIDALRQENAELRQQLPAESQP